MATHRVLLTFFVWFTSKKVGVTALSVALPTYLELVECSSAAGRVRLWISLSIAIFPPACMFALLPLPISPTLPDRFRLVGEDAVQSFLCDLAAVYTTGFVLIAIACRLGDVLAGKKTKQHLTSHENLLWNISSKTYCNFSEFSGAPAFQ